MVCWEAVTGRLDPYIHICGIVDVLSQIEDHRTMQLKNCMTSDDDDDNGDDDDSSRWLPCGTGQSWRGNVVNTKLTAGMHYKGAGAISSLAQCDLVGDVCRLRVCTPR